MKAKTLTLTLLSAMFAIAALLATASCSKPDAVDGEWRDIDGDGWRYNRILRFNAAGDTLPMNVLVLTVRHTSAYPFANLWLEMKYEAADTVHADTLNVVLADRFGHWRGSGSGLTYQYSDTIIPRRAPRPSSPILLRHIMRLDTVPELQQVGISYL